MTKKYYDANHYVVKSIYLCRYLQKEGFELKKVKLNKFNPQYNVYLFEKTDELLQAIDEYRQMKQEAGYNK